MIGHTILLGLSVFISMALLVVGFWVHRLYDMHNVKDSKGRYVWYETFPAPNENLAKLREVTQRLGDPSNARDGE